MRCANTTAAEPFLARVMRTSDVGGLFRIQRDTGWSRGTVRCARFCVCLAGSVRVSSRRRRSVSSADQGDDERMEGFPVHMPTPMPVIKANAALIARWRQTGAGLRVVAALFFGVSGDWNDDCAAAMASAIF